MVGGIHGVSVDLGDGDGDLGGGDLDSSDLGGGDLGGGDGDLDSGGGDGVVLSVVVRSY